MVTGHQHGYERIHPNLAGKVVATPVKALRVDEDGCHAPCSVM